jgi:hypothetical protein
VQTRRTLPWAAPSGSATRSTGRSYQSDKSPGSEVSRTKCPKGSDARTCLECTLSSRCMHPTRSSFPAPRKLSDLPLFAKAASKNNCAMKLHLPAPASRKAILPANPINSR